MKAVKSISLGAILLIGIFIFAAMFPSNVKADQAGFTDTPTPEISDTPTPTVPTSTPTNTPTPTSTNTEPPPPPPPPTTESPTPTVTQTGTITEPPPPPPPPDTETPSRPRASSTPEPLLPETGQDPIDPFQGSGLMMLAVIALVGLSGGLVLGIKLNAKQQEISKDR